MISRRRQLGFTVMELMISLGIGLVLVAAGFGIYLSQHKGFEKVEEISHVTQSARLTIDQLSRELRMAGFGVVTGETFTEAKKYSVTFYGDVDADISGVLAQNVAAGSSQIRVDLRDGRDEVESGDYVFINGGGNVEMIQVASSGEPVSFEGEPDTINLNTALTHDYLASSTLVRTIESTRFNVTFPAGRLTRNGELLVDNLQDLEFHYFGEGGQEMVPDAINGLDQIQRAALRRIELRIRVGSDAGLGRRDFSSSIDLRNMGNRPFTTDTCKPNGPSNLQVVSFDTCERFTLTWTAPTTNNCDGSALTDLGGYKIYYGTSSGDYLTPPTNVSDETLTTYDVHDLRLANNTRYYVTMVAYDQSFNESGSTAEVSFILNDTTPPGPPEDLNGAAGVGTVTLSWSQAEDEDVKGYRLYRGTEPGFTANAGTLIADETVLDDAAFLDYVDEGLDPCTTYYYKISSIDCANEGETSEETHGDGDGPEEDSPVSNESNTTPTESPPSPPGPPSPFLAIGRNEAVDLNWTNPSDSDFAGVIIRYSTISFPSSVLDGDEVGNYAGSPSADMTATHENRLNGTIYYYSAFAYDRCGNYADRVTASAQPGGTAPVAEIIAPENGITVTSGQLLFQGLAYDPDQPGLHEPPSTSLDNGAGITSVSFHVNPSPGAGQFPLAEYQTEYCGFGGDINPCSTGDVTTWCDGTYQLYAVATDDEGQSSPSPYVTIQIHNGGLYLDDEYTPATGGTYNNEVTFQVENDAEASAQILEIRPTWDHQDARLWKVQIPSGSTVWEDADDPAESGDTISLSLGNRPTVSADSTKTVKLFFSRMFTTLSYSAVAGDESVQVASTSGFTEGDTIYLIDGSTVEAAVVESVSAGRLNLAGDLENGFSYGSIVRHTQQANDVQMSGSEIRIVFNYRKSTFANACDSDEIVVAFTAGPQIIDAQQDMPTEDLACSTLQGHVEVENYRNVPVHVAVVDHAGAGIDSTSLFYYVDNSFQTVAPSTGYAQVSMTYNESQSRWNATIPYQSDARVWFYFATEDGNEATDRDPEQGAYVYDYVADTTAPACPLGLVATKIALKQVDMTWTENSEPDLDGYNIYRSEDCGSFTRMYSLVTDSNPTMPGVQYTDDDNRLNTDKYCFTYYITAVDQQGNESSSCSIFTSAAGDCPCP